MLKKSGIGRAVEHQKKALELNEIEYTLNKKDTFDVAHINTYFSKSSNLIKKLKKKGIPVIVHGHSTKEDYQNSFWFWKITKGYIYHSLKKTYSLPNRIITPTPYSKGLIENYDFVHCPVVAISNGIDFTKYHDVSISKEEEKNLRERFGLRPTDRIVLGIGWFFERKGTHDFIEIAKSFDDTTKFIWFGANNKALMTKKILQAIKNKPDNVILPGYVSQDTIIKMLHIADCFVFPSYEETEGIVLLEALACQTPTILRDIPAFSYLTHMKNCLKAVNNTEFVAAIQKAFDEDMTEILQNGVELVKKRDLKIIGSQLKEQYEIVLNDK
ncbi:MAG: glycosyltransferase family 4 protein [Anaeroplasma bactoclasticum]|nr:glycosyltransferase family 4 protein [Anaeroplasma bactoclasticum]